MAAQIVECPTCGQRNRVRADAAGRPACGSCRTDLPWIVDARDDTFVMLAERSPIPALVDFWAPWCIPCLLAAPGLKRVAREMAGRVKLVKVNVDKSAGAARRFEIQAIPTLLLLDRGGIVARRVGAAKSEVIRDWLETSLTRLR